MWHIRGPVPQSTLISKRRAKPCASLPGRVRVEQHSWRRQTRISARFAIWTASALPCPLLVRRKIFPSANFIAQQGLITKDKGGTVEVLAIKPADTLPLMKSGQIDAAWTPEPWTARMVSEAGATLIVEERDLWKPLTFVTTVIVARSEFMRQHPDLVEAIKRGHHDSVVWLNTHPAEAETTINAELKRLTGKGPQRRGVEIRARSRDVYGDRFTRIAQTSSRNGRRNGLPSGRSRCIRD